MKKLILKDSVEDFIFSIIRETSKGEDVLVQMHGYNAIVYAGSTPEMVRRDIIKKLKMIKDYALNISLLRRDSQLPSSVLDRYIDEAMPEDIAELCLEEGLIAPVNSGRRL